VDEPGSSMKASAIIVAAGSGKRLGLATPKAFVSIDRASMLLRVLQTIGAVEAVGEVVVAVSAGAQKSARAEADAAGLQIPVKITQGGAERQDSVRLALMLTSAEADLIVVHDAARPFATPAMFSECIQAAAQSGVAVVAVPVTDTLKQVEQGTIIATVPRDGLWQAQTPQAFRRELLVRAHEWATRERIEVTDDAYLCERLSITVRVVRGSAVNLKVTTPDDLRIGEAIARFVSLR
jgi:2-C-methyl-D-erythritol 4-phosphate cytidylyltransferase